MQFGIFSVSDITRNPVTGRTPSEAERIDAIVQIARRADEVGLDVFAIGEHHNPPFFSSSPTTLLAHIAGADGADRPQHRGHAHHDERPGEDRRGLRDAPAPGQGPAGPDARAREHRAGLSLVRPGHPQGARARAGELQPAAPAVARGRRRLGGRLPHAAAGLHLDSPPVGRRSAVRLARRDPHARDRRAGRVLRQRLLRQQHPGAQLPLQAARRPLPPALRALRPRDPGAGDRRARRARVHRQALAGRRPRVPSVLRGLADLRQELPARGLHGRDAAERRQPAGGDREDAGVPGGLRRLPAPALERRLDGPAAARRRWSRSSCWAPRSCPSCARRWRRAASRACPTRRRTPACGARSTATPSLAGRARTPTAATT